ncbi:MAG: sugar nucleotide-binding protein [Pseudomonadota bacterium]
MRVLVIGGRGFIGRAIVAELNRTGTEVVVGTRSSKIGPGELTVRLHESWSEADWKRDIARVDVVINAAGILRQRWRENYAQVHNDAPGAIARAVAAQGKRFIHISALGLSASARSQFIRSKLDGEKAVLSAGYGSTIVRVPLLDGRGGYGATWLRQLSLLPVWFLPANRKARLSPLPVSELAVAIAALAAKPSANRIVELGGANAMTFEEYLLHLRGTEKFSPVAVHMPRWLGRMLAHVCDFLHFSPYSFGHFELLQFDNLPKANQFEEIAGRRPVAIPRRKGQRWQVPLEPGVPPAGN